MENDYLDEFFEGVYNHEMELKHKLEASDNLVIGVIGVLAGVAGYYIKVLASAEFGVCCGIFWVLCLAFMGLLVCGIYYATRSIWPRDRAYIASPEEFAAFVKGTEDFHAVYHRDEKKICEKVNADVGQLRRKLYIEAAQVNRNVIIAKAGFQTEAKKRIVLAVFVMLASAIPLYFIQYFDAKAKAAKLAPKQAATAPAVTEVNDGRHAEAPAANSATVLPSSTPKARAPEDRETSRGRDKSQGTMNAWPKK